MRDRLFFASIAHRGVLERERLFRRKVDPYSDFEVETNTIYVHIPKAAGNSICRTIYQINHGLGHDKARHYAGVDPRRFESSFKFSFVRNPYDRLVSAFHYLKGQPFGWNDAHFRDEYLSPYSTFEDFVLALDDDRCWELISRWTHFTPQIEFVCGEDRRVIVDFVGRFEQLDQDVMYVTEQLGLEASPLERVNVSKRGDWMDYYTERAQRIVMRRFRSDFEVFGYPMD